ncbi:MAG TPA: HEAT repeat domain-containing protein [Gemmataceae bacterium]
MRTLLKTGLLAVVLLGTIHSPGRAVDRDAVTKAIDKGVMALHGLQAADGTWPHTEIGATALAGLTLLECGVAADDKAVLAAADAVRKVSVNLKHNYSIALAILFFDRLGDPADIPLIESLTVRLLAGQTARGGWNYNCPPVGPGEVRRLQNKLAQRKELTGRREAPKPGAVKRTAKDLPKEIHQQLAILNRMGGGGQEIGSDNSNTQFATLALWVGRRYGLPVEHALKHVESRFRGSQHADGGWGYFDSQEEAMHRRMAGSTASMTCAGLLGLAVADGNFSEKMREKKPGSKFTRDINKDTNLRRGLVALSTTIGQPLEGARPRPGEFVPAGGVGGRTFYFLWSLERVAVALDLKTIGKKDWYAWGAEILLANQHADGSWQGNYGACGADTCFALLFLKRANLVPDLTNQLTGKVVDPGERVLKGSGASSLDGKAVSLKSGLESKDTKPPIEGRYPTPTAKPPQDPPPRAKPAEVGGTGGTPAGTGADRRDAGPPAPKPTVPKTEVKPADSVGARMAARLAKATGSEQMQLLHQMQEGKGADFTVALALAIPQLSGDRQKKTRAALVDRLTRMTDKTLTSYFEDEQPEIRRAAALACARKGSRALIPKVIPLLRHPQRPVIEAAHEALKELTGEDFGPEADAGREDRYRAARRWLDWWNKQANK